MVSRSSEALASATIIATRFSAVRRQGSINKPTEIAVIDYQNQQAKLFPLIAFSYAAHFAGKRILTEYFRVVRLIDQNAPSATLSLRISELHATSSGLKSVSTYIAADGIESCRRLCGGHGFLRASKLSHIFQEFVGACTYEGTFDVLTQQSARFLLKMFQMPNAPLSDTTTIQYIAEAPVLLTETFPVGCRKELRDPGLIIRAYQVRAVRLLSQASESVTRAMKRTNSIQQSRNESMVDLTLAAVAHSHVILVSSFFNAIPILECSEETKAILLDLAFLFAFEMMDKHMAEFRSNDYFKDMHAKWVHESWIELLGSIRQNAISLTDAWHLSDFELKSAIGRYDGDIYRALIASTDQEPLNQSQVTRGFDLYLKPLMEQGGSSKL